MFLRQGFNYLKWLKASIRLDAGAWIGSDIVPGGALNLLMRIL